MLFNVFAARLDNGMKCTFRKYADDIKPGTAGRNFMELNKAECNILHGLVTYQLASSLAEKDLGVPLDKPKTIQQCVAEMKNNCLLGYMRKSTASRPK